MLVPRFLSGLGWVEQVRNDDREPGLVARQKEADATLDSRARRSRFKEGVGMFEESYEVVNEGWEDGRGGERG